MTYPLPGRDSPFLALAVAAITVALSGAAGTPATGATCRWTEGLRVIAEESAGDEHFGLAVALDGETAVIGARLDEGPTGTRTGTARVFERDAAGWIETALLAADDGADDDQFGFAVALSGDTAVVGAPRRGPPGRRNSGAAYVFVRSGGTWTQQAKLVAADAREGDRFGAALAIAGDTLVVGSPWHDFGSAGPWDAGAAYVFVRAGGTWTQQAQLVADDASTHDEFGISVAVSGDAILVGAYEDDHAGGIDAGSAHVFRRRGVLWSQEAKLVADDASDGARFAESVALVDDLAVLGAWGADGARGAAYVFVHAAGTWSQQARLSDDDGAPGDRFGQVVAFAGDRLAVGANRGDHGDTDAGSASVFRRDAGAWVREATVVAPDPSAFDEFGFAIAASSRTLLVGAWGDDHEAGTDAGSAWFFDCEPCPPTEQDAKLTASDAHAPSWIGWDQFGFAVAIDGDTAVVGDFLADSATDITGAAYVFVRDGAGWTEQAKLTASDAAVADFFGIAVAVDDDTIVVGASAADLPEANGAGVAHVFVRQAGTWIEEAMLVAHEPVREGGFGGAVGVAGDTIVVGAPSHDPTGVEPGSVDVFVRSAGGWTPEARLTGGDPGNEDRFGSAVAVHADTIVVGARGAEHSGSRRAGSAYVFARTRGTWFEQARLEADDTASEAGFGNSVDVSGETVLIGAAWTDVGSAVDAGAAYVFVRSAGDWMQRARLTATDAAAGGLFGWSVSLDGGLAVLVSPQSGGTSGPGAAYVFSRDGSAGVAWVQETKLAAEDGDARDAFNDVSLSGSTAVIGVPGHDKADEVPGAAWVFRCPDGSANEPPRCDPGPDLTAGCDGLALDDATADDPDGDVLTFSWTSDCGASFLPSASELNPTVVLGSDCGRSCELTLSVDDGAGGTCTGTVTVTVDDRTPPELVAPLPTDVTVECDAVPDPIEFTATDACDDDVDVSFDETRTDGPCPQVYTLTRTWTATDDCGNEARHVQLVDVRDTTPPDFVEPLPADLTAECDAVPDPVELTATDDCDDDVEVRFQESRTDGDCDDAYTLTRTWAASDDCGNEARHVQLVDVQDTTPPVPVARLHPREPLPPVPPRSPAPPRSACSPPTSGTFRIECAATDACDPAPGVAARVLAVAYDVDSGACEPLVDTLDITCGALVEIRLAAPPCPPASARPARSPRSARTPFSVRSDGVAVVRAADVLLEVTATDRCGNSAAALWDPARDVLADCRERRDDGTCCPELAHPVSDCVQPCAPVGLAGPIRR